MISRIERNQSSPTASVLGRLAGGLGSPSPSCSATRRRQPNRSAGARSEEVWEDPASGYRRRQVGARDPRSGCEMVEVEIPANARLDYPRWGGRPYRQRLWLVEVRCGWTTASKRSTCNAATAWTSASTAR